MIFGQETGMGTALRVVRHYIDRGPFHKITFASGEQALLLITAMPAPSVELVRLSLGGLVPWQSVWEYNPSRAGGYSDYFHKLKAMFSPARGQSGDPDHYIRDALCGCQSIMEARTLLLKRERWANTGANDTADGFVKGEPRSVPNYKGWEIGAVETVKPDGINQQIRARGNGKPSMNFAEDWRRKAVSTVPDRYRIRVDGRQRTLTSMEAPTVSVRAERGIEIPAKRARNYPAGTIFLDGAAQGEPFIDDEKEVYNLNHLEGSIQSLATCEQAICLIRRLGDLRKRDWAVFANDGELDTVLAVWVLLNHLRLKEDPKVRTAIMPLLRLEGLLHAHGPDAHYLSALPQDLLHSTSTMLKQIRHKELTQGDALWSEVDLLDSIADRLRAIDKLIYAPEIFEELHEFEELGRAEISNGSLVVACRSQASLDEVEQQIRSVYGERLGIVIFQNGTSGYVLRRVDPTLPPMLERAYERLNLLDTAVRSRAEKRWGGSAEEGASPSGVETGLAPAEIVKAVRDALREPTFIDIIAALPRALVFVAAALLPTLAVISVASLLGDGGYMAGEALLLSIVVFIVAAGVLFWLKAREFPGLCGCRAPTGFSWLLLLPAGLVGAVMGGVWAPGSLAYRIGDGHLYEFTGLAALVLPIGAELLFRGVIFGHLASRLPNCDQWWRSWPKLISSALYAGATLVLLQGLSRDAIPMSQALLFVGGAFVFGIASARAREQSESVFSSAVLHSGCAIALSLSSRLLF